MKGNGCSHGHSWRRNLHHEGSRKSCKQCPRDQFNLEESSDLVAGMQSSERSFNRAVDNGFVGDLGSLCAVNFLGEDPVYANRINY